MKFPVRFFPVVFVLALAILACSIGGGPAQSGDVLFSDDFSGTGGNWDQVSDSDYTTDYYNSQYRILVNISDSDVWANPGTKNFTDVRVEVDATKNGGPDDNDFGVICRYQDTDNFYVGVISSDGFGGIMRRVNGEFNIIGDDYLRPYDAIYQGAATNRIRFDCVGSTLTLYANGTQLTSATETSFTDGNVGLLAGTYSETGTDILFDNLFVYQP